MSKARDLSRGLLDQLNVDSNTLAVDVANNRVGIGKTDPATALDVLGTITADGLTVDGLTVLQGNLNGPATFIIDPAAHGDDTGTVIIAGNLQVDGLTTTINSTTLTVDDKNIVLASGAPNAAAADGAGITVDGANASLTYVNSGTNWAFNKSLAVTGTVTTDGLTVSASAPNVLIQGVSATDASLTLSSIGITNWALRNESTDSALYFTQDGATRVKLSSGGGIDVTGAATFSGNVGVGSSDFGNAGTINLSVGVAGVTAGGLQLWADIDQTHYMQFGDSTAGGAPYSGAVGYNHATDSLLFLTAGSSKLTISSTGAATFSGTVTADGLTVESATGAEVTLKNTDSDGASGEYVGKLHFEGSDSSSGASGVRAGIYAQYGSSFGYTSLDFLTSISGGALKKGMNISGEGDISFYEDTGTTPKFFWDASAESLAIGIGATSAATINAYSKTVATNLPSALRVIENTTASSYWDIGSTDGATNNLNFYANANTTPKMTLSGAGNLELNVPTGNGLLINSADVATIKMKNTGGGVTNWGFATTNLAAGDFGIYASNSVGGDPITAGTAKLYINSSGNVGIGTSSPSGKLDIKATGSTRNIILKGQEGVGDGSYGPHYEYKVAYIPGNSLNTELTIPFLSRSYNQTGYFKIRVIPAMHNLTTTAQVATAEFALGLAYPNVVSIGSVLSSSGNYSSSSAGVSYLRIVFSSSYSYSPPMSGAFIHMEFFGQQGTYGAPDYANISFN